VADQHERARHAREQVEQPGAGHRVQAGGDLVAHEHLGFGEQGAHERRSLELTAGQAARQASHRVLVQTDTGQSRERRGTSLGGAHAAQPHRSPGDLVQNGAVLVERSACVLEDVLHGGKSGARPAAQ
jgi:hypothetical protein